MGFVLTTILLLLPFTSSNAETIEAFPDQIVSFVKMIPNLESDADSIHWKWLQKIPLYSDQFPTFHPQGLKLVGNNMYLSTVDPTADGSGYMIQYSIEKNALKAFSKVEPKETIKFDQGKDDEANFNHAGGIDFDGKYLWMPLAVYSPKKPTRIYKIEAGENFKNPPILEMEFPDHLGTTILDSGAGLVHFFDWTNGLYSLPIHLSKDHWHLKKLQNTFPVTKTNTGWEFQDCKSIGKGFALCSAVKGSVFIDGQIQLVKFDAETNQLEIIKTIDVPRVNPQGEIGGNLSLERPLTYNAMDFSITIDEAGMIESIRFYFVPHDDKDSTLFVLEAHAKTNRPVSISYSTRQFDGILKMRLPAN